jgi:hypothetical protein
MRAVLLLLVAACEAPSPDWARMMAQQKLEPQEASRFFADGRGMRVPPAGTVPVERITGEPERTAGVTADGRYVASLPVALERPLLERGRDRFAIFCAPCHGVIGDGDSDVAENMTLRRPPSFHDAALRAYPPGRIFAAISRGYGLMPSYASVLSVDDRWAVVAFIGALQLAGSEGSR